MLRSGLISANVDNWQKIWSVNDYEPNPVTASTPVGGVLASYQEHLYWGLMQVPFTGSLVHYAAYPDAPHATLDVILSIIGTTRSIPIFRCCGQAAGGQTELLYGSTVLPAYDETTQSWRFKSNNLRMGPLFGPLLSAPYRPLQVLRESVQTIGHPTCLFSARQQEKPGDETWPAVCRQCEHKLCAGGSANWSWETDWLSPDQS